MIDRAIRNSGVNEKLGKKKTNNSEDSAALRDLLLPSTCPPTGAAHPSPRPLLLLASPAPVLACSVLPCPQTHTTGKYGSKPDVKFRGIRKYNEVDLLAAGRWASDEDGNQSDDGLKSLVIKENKRLPSNPNPSIIKSIPLIFLSLNSLTRV
ncbi:hypothetical protein L1987_04991 [Smallanthus sonchifolius]|uniref:Uncharacterized protein n=1 Tax=Smallanthus sonchifolius TaxID=185202 RepID=A0ACB9JU75_9ASTR|nr:hypothetical protein L1987_04991 [Smallanthus sonchifolius]